MAKRWYETMKESPSKISVGSNVLHTKTTKQTRAVQAWNGMANKRGKSANRGKVVEYGCICISRTKINQYRTLT